MNFQAQQFWRLFFRAAAVPNRKIPAKPVAAI
jgi:hypothetical protein